MAKLITIPPDAKIEKLPGWNWEVTYLDEGEDGRETADTMIIFGGMTVEEAIAEARYSLTALIEDCPAIIKVERL